MKHSIRSKGKQRRRIERGDDDGMWSLWSYNQKGGCVHWEFDAWISNIKNRVMNIKKTKKQIWEKEGEPRWENGEKEKKRKISRRKIEMRNGGWGRRERGRGYEGNEG